MISKQSQNLGYAHIITMMILLGHGSVDMSKRYSSRSLPLWTWECVDRKCEPSKVKSLDRAQSLITCNMLCTSMHLWPQPTGPVSLSATALPVRADLFQLQIESYSSIPVREHLQEAFDLFKEDLRKLEHEAFGFEEWRGVALRASVNKNGSTDPRMLLSTDESYNLTIKLVSNSLFVELLSNSFCGARHGLETLLQLIWFDPYVGSLFMMEAAHIEDAPRFRYRGLLLDTASNYFPVSDILRTVDAMAASKLNSFHWYATNSQAIPLLLNSVPQLAWFRANSSEAMYTAEDVRKVVKRAQLRGIRVLLEVDVLSHVSIAREWETCKDKGAFIHCVDKHPWSTYCTHSPCVELHPHNSRVFDLLEGVYREILQLTGVEDILHIGDYYISSKCSTEQFNSSNELWIEFTRKVLQRLASVNGKLPDLTLMWSSHLSERIKMDLQEYISNIGLQVRTVGWAQKHVSGVRTVISHEDAWDLNTGLGTWNEVSVVAPYNSWQRMYEYRPWARGSGCIEGGEATAWSSMLGAGELDARLWPRAASFAERLWSDRLEGATKAVHARLDIHRSRLVSRNIQVSPLWSMWCTHNPYTCN